MSHVTYSSGYILVAEDDAFTRHLMLRLLEPCGREAVGVQDGRTALELVDRQLPSMLLLDLMMAGPGGLEVCQRIRSQSKNQDLPIVVCTAYRERKMLEAALRAGATSLLLKPFRQEALLDCVARHALPAPCFSKGSTG